MVCLRRVDRYAPLPLVSALTCRGAEHLSHASRASCSFRSGDVNK